MDDLKTLTTPKLTYNMDELALTLNMTRRTVQNLLCTAPHRLPPCVVLPGSQERFSRVWRVADVDDWLKQHRVHAEPPV